MLSIKVLVVGPQLVYQLDMRFKAKLVPEQLSLLNQVIVPMSKIAATSSTSNELSSTVWTRNSCILHLDDSFLRLFTKGKSTDMDNILCYAEFNTRGGIFIDHRIESAVENNAIAMEIDLAQLRLALTSLVQDKKHTISSSALSFMGEQHYYTILKLAKRNNVPCLCLDSYTGSGDGGMPIQVHHSIAVRIMRVSDMAYYKPPKVGHPDVQLELPLDKPFKSVVDGLKTLGSGGGSSSSSSTVTLHATTQGELTISLDSDGASIRAFFNHLAVPENHKESQAKDAQVKVDTKKLCTCLQWQQSPLFPVSRAVLCLVENEVLLVHLELQPPSVGLQTYYIPIHFLPADGDLT